MAAIRSAQLGLKTVIIEETKWGDMPECRMHPHKNAGRNAHLLHGIRRAHRRALNSPG